MKQGVNLVAILACMLSLSARALAQVSPGEIVDKFYPQTRLDPEDPDHRESCYAVYSSENRQPATIMAGYANRVTQDAVIRVIERNAAGSYAVTHEVPATYEIMGQGCDAYLPDVDFDGKLDVAFSFGGRGGSEDWLFKWDGTQLISITPTRTENGTARSELNSASPFDVTHSGWMQFRMPGFWGALEDNQPAPAPQELWEAVDEHYQQTRFFLEITKFEVGRLQLALRYPINLQHFRQSQDSVPPFRVRVVNGDRAGRHRIRSGTITVNDVVVIGPEQLTSRAEFVEVTLPALPIENLLRVQLTGDPDAYIVVTVSDSTVRKP